MVVLRSALFQAGFYLTFLAFLPLLLVLALPRRWGYRIAKAFVHCVLWQLEHICGLSYEVRGRERIPPGSILFASKHQSSWETLALTAILQDPAMVVKQELTWLPIFGWAVLKLQHIAVRRTGDSMASFLKSARARRDAGRAIVIFPEGTRVSPGDVSQYKLGVVALYRALGVPCVPVALNSGVFWPCRSWRRFPGRIVVEFLDPIMPGMSRREFMPLLQDQIETGSRRLALEATGHGDSGGAT
jgi:1-acyl-sn-glycerol-3-phosphate acyltransferase